MNTITNKYDQSLSITYRGMEGRTPRFAALNAVELCNRLSQRFPEWTTEFNTREKRTKRAIEFGGGSQSIITLRSGNTLQLHNGELLRGQIVVRDQDYAGRALTVEFGLYRLVCTNGLMAFRSISEPIRIPHHMNRTEMLLRLDQIILDSSAVFQRLVDEANRLTLLPVSDWSATLTAVATAVGLPKYTVQSIERSIANRMTRAEDNAATVWGVYNIINEFDRRNARRNSTAYADRDREVLDLILQNAA